VGNNYIIRNIIIAAVMAALSLWMATTELVFGSIAAIFFASMALILLIRHFKYSNRRRRQIFNGEEQEEQQKNALSEGNNEIFTFSNEAFTIKIEQEEKLVAWRQVQSMIAYKIDRFATDNISLDVFCEHNISFTITEESAAWEKFLDHSKRSLPIDKFWEIEMVALSFETNPTVVYDHKNRSLKEIVKKYYNA
jgi:hypothetical protein